MISTATLQEYLDVTGNEATLERIERGVVAFLSSWIPHYLGPPREKAVVLSGGTSQAGGLIWHGQRDQSSIQLPEEIAFEDLVQVQHRSSPSLPWEDLGTLDDYEVEGRSLYRRSAAWPAGQRNVRVVYMEGFEVDQGPHGVTLVALELVKAKWERREKGGIKTERAGHGGMSVTYADAVNVPGLQESLGALKRSRNF